MKRIVASRRFERSYKKYIKKHPERINDIKDSINSLSSDKHTEKIKIHKLSGQLKGMLAFSCGYDCRITFSYEVLDDGEEVILLVEIGKQDEIY